MFFNIFKEKSLVEVMQVLRERGYIYDFNLLKEKDSYIEGGNPVDLNDLVIDKTYRFTGLSSLEDESILYAIRIVKDGAKGIFVNAYGIYSDSKAQAIIKQILKNQEKGK